MRNPRLITLKAVLRISLLLVLAAASVLWSWWVMIRMPLQSYHGPWIPLGPQEIPIRDRLSNSVHVLAADIGDRNVFRPAQLEAAASYIETTLSQAGYTVRRQPFTASGQTCLNLEATIPGRVKPEEIVVVGAHYDSVAGCPGANDNGSAVAALLSLAQSMRHDTHSRTLRFVAFANEEPPFFQTELMGSLVYAKEAQAKQERIVAMISLETMGYFSEEKGSQRYPFPIGLCYPDTGNFIAFVGNIDSGNLVRQCVARFRRDVTFPSEGGALPGWLPGIGWSDHWSFWQAGYPALMVTDTAPFRYPHYHTLEDTTDKLDYDRLARVVSGLEKVIRDLSQTQSPK